MTLIAEVPAPTTIVFGTDGWRARVADDFTFEAVRRCADGVAEYVVERGQQAKGVVIAYDRRFASEHFAIAAAEVLLARDIPVAYAARDSIFSSSGAFVNCRSSQETRPRDLPSCGASTLVAAEISRARRSAVSTIDPTAEGTESSP